MPERKVVDEDQRLDQWRRLLGAYDYQRQLERGYSVTRDASGRVVRSIHGVDAGALLRTRLADGELASTVEEISEVVVAARPLPSDRDNEEGNK